MCAEISQGLCWLRARYGPRKEHNVGTVSYSALIISTVPELPNAAAYLYGRVASEEDDKLTITLINNPAHLAKDDAEIILSAIHRQVEGNDAGEMSAAPPIVLIDWLSTLFATDRAKEIARMLQLTAFGRDGDSDGALE
jgi:hypothetical protein